MNMKILNTLVVTAIVLLTPTSARLVPEHRKLQEVPPGATVIPDEYIVIFEKSVAPTAVNATAAAAVDDLPDGTLAGTYTTLFQGFAVSDVADPTLLAENDVVKLVIPNFVMTINGGQQRSPPLNLDRIDEMDFPLDGLYNYNCDGTDVYAYVIDTGIRLTHLEFGGRARCGVDFVGTSCDDFNGHGTHVAGTIGGAIFGVAKGVNLVAVKVFAADGSGTLENLLKGILYVAGEKLQHPTRKMVVNMSFSYSVVIPFLDTIVNVLVGLGVPVVVSADDLNVDACSSSPGRAVSAVTVGATDTADFRYIFSNFGTCVDIFAPGVGIVSAGIASNIAFTTFSGTSQASALVAGVVSMYLQDGKSVQNMLNDAVVDRLNNLDSSPNRLVNVQKVCLPPPPPRCRATRIFCSKNRQCCSGACKKRRCI